MAFGPATYADHIAGGLVRELWPEAKLIEEIINEDPILGAATKETDWNDSKKHFPLGWGGSQAVTRNFAATKKYKSRAKQQEFVVETKEMFQALSLEGKLLRSAQYGGRKAKAHLVDPVSRESERAIEAMRRRFCRSVHGNGVGVIGKIAAGSDLTTDTVLLTEPNDLKNFPIDTPLHAEHTGLTGGTIFDGEAVVTGQGTEDNPTVTIDQPWQDAFPGIAVGDYLYVATTYDDDFIYGFDAFNPLYTGNPGTFLTANRNLHPQWLAGYCLDATNLTFFQAIKRGARILHDNGGKPDIALMSTRMFEMFEFENAGKLKTEKVPAAKVGSYELGVSYDAIIVQGPRGPIKTMASPWMPDGIIRVGQLSTIVIGSIGPLVHWDSGNGPGDLRTEDATDNRELRAVSDPAFVNKAPGRWIRIRTAMA